MSFREFQQHSINYPSTLPPAPAPTVVGGVTWGSGIGGRVQAAGLAPIAGRFGFDFYRSSRASALPVDFMGSSLRAELLAKRSGVFVGRRMLRRRRVREL